MEGAQREGPDREAQIEVGRALGEQVMLVTLEMTLWNR